MIRLKEISHHTLTQMRAQLLGELRQDGNVATLPPVAFPLNLRDAFLSTATNNNLFLGRLSLRPSARSTSLAAGVLLPATLA
jgi:hypothetical protein